MELKYVEPAYTVAEKRSLFTKTLDGNRRLDIVARPLNPGYGDIPNSLKNAFESVVWIETYFNDKRAGHHAAHHWFLDQSEFEKNWETYSHFIALGVEEDAPGFLNDERTAYFCPIDADKGDGYRRGYVVAWEESDALDVAAYMAGGRVDIYLDLLDFNGEYLGGEWLGDVDYSDLENDTDAYRRVVAGESFALAMETIEGIEAPEPNDPEFPGEELLETFTKLS